MQENVEIVERGIEAASRNAYQIRDGKVIGWHPYVDQNVGPQGCGVGGVGDVAGDVREIYDRFAQGDRECWFASTPRMSNVG